MKDSRIAAVILAAGASRRMRGRDKLMEEAGGTPLLRRVADSAWSSMASEVVVVLGARADVRRGALDGLAVRFITNSDWQAGMAQSIRAGIASLDDSVDGAIIMLGDMPEVGPSILNQLITMFDPERGLDIIRPRAASGPIGNPILFGRAHFAALSRLSGDTGAKAVIAANPDRIFDMPTDDDGVLIDLDTPEAWAAWRSEK